MKMTIQTKAITSAIHLQVCASVCPTLGALKSHAYNTRVFFFVVSIGTMHIPCAISCFHMRASREGWQYPLSVHLAMLVTEVESNKHLAHWFFAQFELP